MADAPVNLTVNCFCGCAGAAPAGGRGLVTIEGGNLQAWRAAIIAQEWTDITCPVCGCTQDLIDGVTQVRVGDRARPRLDTISAAVGPATGGTQVIVRGHRLLPPDVVVKFAGLVGLNPRYRQDGQVIVDTPPHAAGVVDVTVENRYGQRVTGGKLAAAFTYS